MNRQRPILVLAFVGVVTTAFGQVETQVVASSASQTEVGHVSFAMQEDELPYSGDYVAMQSTIGQLCKECAIVVVGVLRSFQWIDSDPQIGSQDTVSIVIDVTTNLCGDVVKSRVVVKSDWDRGVPFVQVGAKVMAFVSNETYSPTNFSFLWSFDRTRTHGMRHKVPVLLGKHRGLFALVEDNEDILTATVLKYLHHLRDPKREENAYYVFLRDNTLSPIGRIRDDAKQDLIFLLGSSTNINLNDVVEDGVLDKNIRQRVKRMLLKQSSPGKP